MNKDTSKNNVAKQHVATTDAFLWHMKNDLEFMNLQIYANIVLLGTKYFDIMINFKPLGMDYRHDALYTIDDIVGKSIVLGQNVYGNRMVIGGKELHQLRKFNVYLALNQIMKAIFYQLILLKFLTKHLSPLK